MQTLFAKPSRIALGFMLLGALTLGGLGCGGGGTHPTDAGKDAKAGADGAAGATGTAGGDGSAGVVGTGGATAGNDGGAGSDAAAGNDGSAGAAGNDGGAAAGNDGGAGAAGHDGGAAGNDGGAGSDAAAGTDGGAAGADASDGGASDASDASDGGDAADTGCTNACTLGAKQCGGGGVQTCVMGSGLCTVWGAATACAAHQACAVGSSGAACTCIVDPNCGTGTATFCASTSSQSTCGTDSNGCFFVASTTACPAHQDCRGNNPTGACDCTTPPTECMSAAGTTFCSTSTSVSTCKTDSSNSKNCLFADTAVGCGTHQACSTPTAGAAVCKCNADPNGCTLGNSPSDICGAGNTSVHCALDADSCPVGAVTQCNTHSACDGTTGLCKCNASVCTTAGPTCDTGNVSTCAQDGACFYVSATAATCTSNETCQGANGAASCLCKAAPAVCTAGAGTYCDSGAVTTCVADAHGCVTVSTTQVACNAHSTCQGAAGSGACVCNPAPASCTAAGTFCSNGGTTTSTCQMDGACPFDAGNDAPCALHQSCKGAGIGQTCTCDNTCSPQQASGSGTYCIGTSMQATCATDGASCRTASPATSCVGVQFCQGADGVGSCQCPPAGTTAGTGCTTLGATVCQGNTVLTCINDVASACHYWAQPHDCVGDSLVCGTKAGGVAACQCGENGSTDFHADPVGGTSATSGIFATGIASPAECRFKTLTAALANATAPGSRVIADTDAPPAVFVGETFPLVVNPGVVLKTIDTTPTPGNYVIVVNSAGASAVSLLGSTFQGFTVLNSTGNAGASAVSVTGQSVVDNVELDGTAATTLLNGIRLSAGAEGSSLNAVNIQGFTLGINDASGIGFITLTNGKLSANAVGISVSDGTFTASSTTVSGGTNGVAIRAAGGATATFNGASLVVSGATSAGIIQSSVGGTVALNLTTGVEIKGNGTSGLSFAAGTGTLGDVNIHNNTTSGIAQSGGTLTIGSGATTMVQTNATGVTLSGGTLNVGAGTITGNTGNGVTASGSSTLVSSTGAQYTSNGGNGIAESSATLTFTGSAAAPILVKSNTGDGLSLTDGNITANYLTVSSNGTGATKKSGLEITGAAIVNLGTSASDAASSFSSNGLHGVFINGSALGSKVAVNHASITGNGGDGVLVDLNGGTAATAATASFDTDTVMGNGQNGIEILRAPAAVSATVMNMNNLTVTGNGTSGAGFSGVFVSGLNGSVLTLLQNSKVSANTGTGVTISNLGGGSVTESIQGNDINQNTVGGIVFNGVTTLSGFSANLVHGNTGDQVSISAQQVGNAAYNFSNASATICDANRNQFYCYAIGSVGVRVSTATDVVVNAQDVSWKTLTPSNGNDFVIGPTGSGTPAVNFTPTCPAIAACP